MNLLNTLNLRKIEIPLGEKKNIEVPMKIAMGSRKDNFYGILDFGNNFRSWDLQHGHFIKLKGYKGTFKIESNQDSWSGWYWIVLKREDVQKEYNWKVIKIKTFKKFPEDY